MSILVKEITAYQCNECGKAYMTRNAAELCCKPKECACGASIEKDQWRCDTCKEHAAQLKWECAERKPLQNYGWLYSNFVDEYFQDHEEFIEGLDIEEEEFDELMALSASEFARRFQVYICKPHKPNPFTIHDKYDDFCFEDHELPGLWLHAEQSVNDWIASVPDNDWPQIQSAIAWSGQYLTEVTP